jgi:hypothetical protein
METKEKKTISEKTDSLAALDFIEALAVLL